MKKTKKEYTYLLFVILLLSIGVGYAYLTTNLNITGTTTLKDNRWDIHLENVQVRLTNITVTTPTINTTKDTVTYSITLNKPGDFYEFSVDCKNDGSIDGMISNVSSKLNGTEITTLPTALSYSLTYNDDVEIENNHLLPAGEKVTYKIRVGYRTDITASDLPDTEQTLNFSFTVTYVQADNNAIDKPSSRILYTADFISNIIGNPISNDSVTYIDYLDAYNAANDRFNVNNDSIAHFFKFTLNENDNIKDAYIGFILNNNLYYLQGAGATPNSNNLSGYNFDSVYYQSNKAILFSAIGKNNCTEETSDEYGTSIQCITPEISASATDSGEVIVRKTLNRRGHYGMINPDGSTYIGYLD